MSDYIPRGIPEVGSILANSRQFLVYYDPDIDGGCSGRLFSKFLRAFNQPYSIYINENRAHGFKLTDDNLTQLKGQTIVLVDAQVTSAEIKKIISMGVNIINIDHHHLNEEDFVYLVDETTGCAGVIVNNQYPFEPEEMRFLSGAGVVYYVLNALSPGFCDDDDRVLVGLSLLSDIRPIDNPIAKEFLYTTYTHKSPLTDYLVEVVRPTRDFGFGVYSFDRNFIDFTFSPRINALFRLNKGYDAIKVFDGEYVNTGQLDVYRNVQNAIVDTIVENTQGEDLSNLSYKYIDVGIDLPYEYDITNFIGVACSKLKNNGHTTIMFARDGDRIVRGSVRGLCDDVDYLSIFRRHGFTAEGHRNAFGVLSVDFDKVDISALNSEIAQYEAGYEERKYDNRIFEVNNLAFFVRSKNAQIADYNNYVRDNHRIYIQYTGSNVEKYKKGKATEYVIDGLKVICFTEGVGPENGLILPVMERGNYINFYLNGY